jgi:hypothetical protein
MRAPLPAVHFAVSHTAEGEAIIPPNQLELVLEDPPRTLRYSLKSVLMTTTQSTGVVLEAGPDGQPRLRESSGHYLLAAEKREGWFSVDDATITRLTSALDFERVCRQASVFTYQLHTAAASAASLQTEPQPALPCTARGSGTGLGVQSSKVTWPQGTCQWAGRRRASDFLPVRNSLLHRTTAAPPLPHLRHALMAVKAAAIRFLVDTKK